MAQGIASSSLLGKKQQAFPILQTARTRNNGGRTSPIAEGAGGRRLGGQVGGGRGGGGGSVQTRPGGAGGAEEGYLGGMEQERDLGTHARKQGQGVGECLLVHHHL